MMTVRTVGDAIASRRSATHPGQAGRRIGLALGLLLALLLALGGTTTAGAAPNVTSATQKGSALIFPDIRVDGEGADWNTLIRIQNDGSLDVTITCYWMDGNKNRTDFSVVLTRNQPVWFDARTGQGTHQINPFPKTAANGFDNPYLLTPPSLDEATDGPGLYFKGALVCWATDAGRQQQVKWNHLSGTATLYHPQVGAYEYDAYAFFAPTGLDQGPVGTAGTLSLDGVVYDTCPLYQIGQFSPAPVCGNGIVAGTETCDDGNLANGDGCANACAVEPGFTCTGAPSVCAATCGDGITAAGETCDDGNTTNGDGCSAVCTPEAGFTCVGTPSVCATTCGDGILAGAETCDDGNTTNGDGCSAVCTPEAGFTCAGTPSVCATTCGDGILAGAEACDDGNTASGDGCSSTCTIEAAQGAACGTNAGCASGFCVDGVCCDSACTGTCQSCSLAGSVGACTPVPVNTDPDNECAASDPNTCGTTGFCSGAGACQLYPASTPTPAQTTGDCRTNVCTGTGSSTGSPDDTDVPADDGNQCTLEVCTAGVPSHPNAPAGTSCNQNGGTTCNGAGACVVAKFVFVTSTLHTGDLGGLAGADGICSTRAAAAGLPGTYLAWLSTSGASPATRFTQSAVPYIKVDGVQVADNWADLIDGSLDSPIDKTESNGSPPVGNTQCSVNNTVWTGTQANGTLSNAAFTCSGWTTTAAQATWGLFNNASSFWSNWCSGGTCGWTSPLYCFQQ